MRMSLKTETQQQSDTSFECPICLKRFPYRYRLKQHERSLHKTTRYRSNKSLKKAFTSLNRLQYRRVHQGKWLTQQLHLNQPHWKHTDEHLCQICDTVFISHRQLTTHLLQSHRNVFQSHCHLRNLSRPVKQNGVNSENDLHKKPVRNSISLLKACKTTSKKCLRSKLQLGKSRRSSCKENHHRINLVECEKDSSKGKERKNIFESLSEGGVMILSDPITVTTANNHLAHVELNESNNPVQLSNGSSTTLKTAIECLQSKINSRFSSLRIVNGGSKTQTDSSLGMIDLKRRKISPCRTPTQSAHKRVMRKYHRHRLHMNLFTKSKYTKLNDSAENLFIQSNKSNTSFETEFLKSLQVISNKVPEIQGDNSEISHESMGIPNLQHYQSGPIIGKSNKTMPDLHSPEIGNSNEYSNFLSKHPPEDNVCEKSNNVDLGISHALSQPSYGSKHLSESDLFVDSDPTKNSCCVELDKLGENNNLNLEDIENFARKSKHTICTENKFEENNESRMYNSLISCNENSINATNKLDIEDGVSNVVPFEWLNSESGTECRSCSGKVGRVNNVKVESNDKVSSPVKWQQQFLSFINKSENNVSTPSSPLNLQKKRPRAKRSNVCSCCILSATPGKKKRHGHHKLGRPKNISYVLPHGYQEFTRDMVCLLTLRHKVHRLLCTLFPRCLMVLQSLHPESEKVEILIDEIIGNLDDIDCYNTSATQTDSIEMTNNTRITSSANGITKSESRSYSPIIAATNQNNVEELNIVDYSLSLTGSKVQCIPSPEECCLSPSTRNKCEIVCSDEFDEAVIDRNINSNFYSETSDYFSEQNSTSPDYENLSQNSGSPGTEVICRDYKENVDSRRIGKDFLKDNDKNFVKTDCEEMKCDGEQNLFDDANGATVSAPTNQKLLKSCDKDEGIIDIQEETIRGKHIQSDSAKTQNMTSRPTDNMDFEITSIEREYSVTRDVLKKEHSGLFKEQAFSKNYPFVTQDLPVCEGVGSGISLFDLNAISCHITNDLDKELISMKFHSDMLGEDSLNSKPQIILCKKPQSCLKVLKTKIITLIHSLLPELPIEKYFSPDDLGYLLDVLSNINEMSD